MTTLCLIVLMFANPQERTLDEVARQIAAQIVAEPKDLGDIYHPTFTAAIKQKGVDMTDLSRDFFAKHGSVTSVVALPREDENSGQFTFFFEKGVQMKVSLTLTPTPPRQVIGLWFGPPTASYQRIEEIVSEISQLPGQVSFALARLGDSMEILYAHNPDESLAIGSTFKLYILGTLVEDHRKWDEVLHLEERSRSLPSGAMHKWPAGAPITVHSLAAAMVSVSDNTATDHLLHYAGRERIEGLLDAMGNRAPGRSKPFLTTMEIFKLKSDPPLLRRYVGASTDERRAMLAGEIAAMPYARVQPYSEGMPTAIDKIEWFASAADLCRLMDWFRRKNDQTALDIMAINAGIDISQERFPYIGYKGGSEPGVLNMTWLLRHADGTYYALSAGWNNPTVEGTDLMRMIGLVQPLIDLLGSSKDGSQR